MKSQSLKIQSMTGFGSADGEIAGRKVRIEIRTVNHRSLDLKIRLPRELMSVEMPLRTYLQNQFARGAMEFRLEKVSELDSASALSGLEFNFTLAKDYLAKLEKLSSDLRLPDRPSLSMLLALPDVISKNTAEIPTDLAWKELEPLVEKACKELRQTREHEGLALVKVLTQAIDQLEASLIKIKTRRKECEKELQIKFTEKVKSVFDAFPMAKESVQAVLETRIAQELALILERTDIEEETDRFKGHLDHLRKTLAGEGPVGRKLDFLLQETNREANTLSNKAQDLSMSTEAVQVKLKLEQLREQSMNLE